MRFRVEFEMERHSCYECPLRDMYLMECQLDNTCDADYGICPLIKIDNPKEDE